MMPAAAIAWAAVLAISKFPRVARHAGGALAYAGRVAHRVDLDDGIDLVLPYRCGHRAGRGRFPRSASRPSWRCGRRPSRSPAIRRPTRRCEPLALPRSVAGGHAEEGHVDGDFARRLSRGRGRRASVSAPARPSAPALIASASGPRRPLVLMRRIVPSLTRSSSGACTVGQRTRRQHQVPDAAAGQRLDYQVDDQVAFPEVVVERYGHAAPHTHGVKGASEACSVDLGVRSPLPCRVPRRHR